MLISQIVTSPMLMRVFVLNFSYKIKTITMSKNLGTLFGIWNLDFFRVLDLNICFKKDTLAILSLDLLIAVYPFVLIILTHLIIFLHNRNFKLIRVICKVPLFLTAKLCRKNFNIESSTVDAFVTFMLLSYVKTLYVCLDLLVPVTLHSMEDKQTRHAVFMDASLSYFSREHKFYAIPAAFVCLVFVISPVAVLFFYTFACFQKGLNMFARRWQIIVRFIVDPLQGRYKDGTEPGTRDKRWFSAIPFLLRFVYFGMMLFVFNTAIIPCLTQVTVLSVILTIVSDPFKDVFNQLTDSFSLSMLFFAIVLMLITGMDYSFIISGPLPYPLLDFSLIIYIVLF